MPAPVATLQFRLQEDGRRVSRLPSGKVVLVALGHVERVKDGEWWEVEIEERETFAIAHLLKPTTPPSAAAVHAAAKPPLVAAPARTPAPLFPALRPGEMLPEPPDVLSPTDRVALFVDSANITASARDLGFFVDWKRAREYFTDPAKSYAAFFYVGTEMERDSAQIGFLDFLTHAGYIVRTKPVKQIVDTETGEITYKANLDVEIALDMMDTLDHYDVAFLFSGDGDFARAAELLRSRRKKVFVVAARNGMARELAYIADKPLFFLDNYRSVLARQDRKPGQG